MADALSWIEKGFVEELHGLMDRKQVDLEQLLARLPDAEAEELGRRGARSALAPLLWKGAVGETFETTEVCQLLGVTRQAVAKRVHAGSLLGLPGRGTTHFPVWQFDLGAQEIRSVVRDVIEAFDSSIGHRDPMMIASWASTLQHEDLDGLSPSEWLAKGLDSGEVVQAARQAASRLAR